MATRKEILKHCCLSIVISLGLYCVTESINDTQNNTNINGSGKAVSLRAEYPGMYGGAPGMGPQGMMPGMMQGMPPQGMMPGMMPQQNMGMPEFPYGAQPGMMQGMPPQGFGGMPPGYVDPSMMMQGVDPSGIDPNDPVQQALSLHQAGRYADAIQIYESIIINNTPDPRVYASIADAHFRLGNLDRSLKYCVEALKIDPNYASGHLLIGTILGEMGDMVRAIRSYERVIALDQNNPYAYYNLGLLYYKKSDIRTAIEYLERARDLNPGDPKVWNNLGVAYYDNGQFTKAASAYSQSMSLDPGYSVAKKNMELVRDKIPAAPIVKAAKKKVVKKSNKASSAKKKK